MRPIERVRDTILVGRYFQLDFERTLRIPDDGKIHPLPPGLGSFPIRLVRDHAERVPASWRERGGVFVPMYQREALWLAFWRCAYWHPVAVKVGVGGVDALSGKPFTPRLHDDPQDYLVAPHQPWLDGINVGNGIIRQFVAARLGEGLTVEAQLTGAEEVGGIQLTVVEPKKGRFPTTAPVRMVGSRAALGEFAGVSESTSMGLGAGGQMTQNIYPDQFGLKTWDQSTATTMHVHIADSLTWKSITGEEPPPSPIDVETYNRFRLPWFTLYDEHKGDIAPAPSLAGVKSMQELEGRSVT